jgi:hypothetical protein
VLPFVKEGEKVIRGIETKRNIKGIQTGGATQRIVKTGGETPRVV